MRGLLLLIIARLAAGCGCHESSLDGQAEETPCQDEDGDEYPDEACGGDDCDDSNPLIFPGAPEVCLDGVDQDCDGLVDGPMLMASPVEILDGSRLVEGYILRASLQWTGSGFAFYWWQVAEGGTYCKLLNSLGEIRGEETRARTGEPGFNLTWTGSEFGTIWYSGSESSRDVYFQLLSLDGEALSGETALTSSGTAMISDERSPIVWTGSEFVVGWIDLGSGNAEMFIGRADRYGERRGDDVQISDLSMTPDSFPLLLGMAWTGSSIGLLWCTIGPIPYEDHPLYFSLLDSEGDRIVEDVLIDERPLEETVSYGEAVWTGSQFGVFWWVVAEAMTTFFTSIDPYSGNADETTEVMTVESCGCGLPDLAWTGSEYGLIWTESTDGVSSPMFQLVSVDGEARHESLPLPHDSRSRVLGLAWTGSEFGAAITDRTSSEPDVVTTSLYRIGLCD